MTDLPARLAEDIQRKHSLCIHDDVEQCHLLSDVAAAIREALEEAEKIAHNPYSNEVGALGGRRTGDEPLAVGAKIAAAIAALRGNRPEP